MLHEWLCDLALSPGLDYLDDPPRATRRDALHAQQGTLIRFGTAPPLSSVVIPPDRRRVSRGVQTIEPKMGKSALLGLPVEVLSNILCEAVLLGMLPDDGSWGDIAIDCLRPDEMSDCTRYSFNELGLRFTAACKSCMLVCRAFYAIVMPLFWRDPTFSSRVFGPDIPSFIKLLPQTTAVAFPPSFAPPSPFADYVRTLSPFYGALRYQTDMLLEILPLLPNLTTLNLGRAAGEMPFDVLQSLVLVAPSSLTRLPDVLLDSTERRSQAVKRFSAILSLAGRCGGLEHLDVTFGQTIGEQLDELLFALKLQGLRPVGDGMSVRGAALMSLAFNEGCKITVPFLEALPSVAPSLSSFHLEAGSHLVPGANQKSATFDVESFVRRLPHLRNLSWTATCLDVVHSTDLDSLLDVRPVPSHLALFLSTHSTAWVTQTHPRMENLQLFISSISTRFLSRLASSSPALPVRCLCLLTHDDDLYSLLVMRRPWRIRSIARRVLDLESAMADLLPGPDRLAGTGLGGKDDLVMQKVRMDLWRRAGLDFLQETREWDD